MCLCCRSSFKCHKITAVSLFIFSVILIVLGIVMPIVLESLLKNMARENVVMTPKTYETWGRVPGDTNMQIVRRFQFFEFYNPYETVFLNKTPIFIETKPYEYQEFQNFTNVTYRNLPDSDVEVIDFNYWEYMHKMEVGNASDKVKLVNLAGFGAWYQLGTAEDYLIAIQAFGQLIGGLEDEIYEFALAQGILGMLLTSKEQALQRFESYGITPDKADLLWEDPQYGWKNATTLHVWVKAAKEGLFKKTANSLQDYFHLVFTKIDALLRSLKNNVDMIETILVNNYCKDKVNVTCDSRYLAALQWAQQGVTKYPPGGVGGSDSIISTNTTADGFPEISFFYKEYFLKKINNSTSYQNIVFDVMWVYNITKRSGDANNWLTDENLVFHQGNMKFLFEQGRKFDKSQNLDDLISIKNRFRLKSLQQTHVFWAYFNYLVTEFAAMTNRNGSKETLGLGALSSQYFYVGFMEIKDFLFRELKREVLLNLMKNNKIGCKDLINNSIIDEVNVTEICLDIQLIKWDLDTMDYLQDICGINQSIWNDFRERHNLTKTNMFELCANSSENIYSFGPMLDLVYLKI